MRVIYFLPKVNFFTERVRGRTSHAHGFFSGLRKNKADCLLVSGPGYESLYGVEGAEVRSFLPKLISRINSSWVAYCAIKIIRDKELNAEDSVLIVRYATSTSYITSWLFGLLWKGKCIYEVNSLGYHQVRSRSKALLTLILAVEKRLIAAFDAAICVSENISSDLGDAQIPRCIIPNGSSLPAVRLKGIRRERPRFVYLGGFQPYYDFGQLFRCFLEARIKGVDLHIYGSSDRYAQEYPEYVDYEWVKLMGSYDLTELLNSEVLSRYDVLVLPNGRNRMARIGSPTKLFEYLAFGNRIVYQDYGQAGDILEGLASVYPYSDDKSLIRVLELLTEHYHDEFQAPVAEAEYAAQYTWEARAKSFLAYIAPYV